MDILSHAVLEKSEFEIHPIKRDCQNVQDSEVNNFVKYGRMEHQELVPYRGEQGLQCAQMVFSSGRKSPIYGWSRTQPKVEKSIKNRREIVKIEIFSFWGAGSVKKGVFARVGRTREDIARSILARFPSFEQF